MDIKTLICLIVVLPSVLCQYLFEDNDNIDGYHQALVDNFGAVFAREYGEHKSESKQQYQYRVKHPMDESASSVAETETKEERRREVDDPFESTDIYSLLERASYDSLRRQDSHTNQNPTFRYDYSTPKARSPSKNVEYSQERSDFDARTFSTETDDSNKHQNQDTPYGGHVYFEMSHPAPRHSTSDKPRKAVMIEERDIPKRRATARSKKVTKHRKQHKTHFEKDEKEDGGSHDLHTAPVNSRPTVRAPEPQANPSYDRVLDTKPAEGKQYYGKAVPAPNYLREKQRPRPGSDTPDSSFENFQKFFDDGKDEEPVSYDAPTHSELPDFGMGGAHREQFHEQGTQGHNSYKFGYNTGDLANPMERYEERDADGYVRGRYSFVDALGKLQVVHYESDPERGFRTSGSPGSLSHAGF